MIKSLAPLPAFIRNKSWLLWAIGTFLILFVVLPQISRLGFCQGWWLQDNFHAHRQWRCTCSLDYEQNYYKEIEVIVPSCRVQKAFLSTQGQYLVIENPSERFLLNLETRQETPWPYETLPYNLGGGFWDDTLYLGKQGLKETWKLVDVKDGRELKLTKFEATVIDETTDLNIPTAAMEVFKQVDKILIRRDTALVMGLASNPEQSSAMNYALSYPIRPKHYAQKIEEFLTANGLDYQYLEPCTITVGQDRGWCKSYDGRFVSRSYILKTPDDEQVLNSLGNLKVNRDFISSVGVMGWAHDNSGVYLSFRRECIRERVGIMVFPWTTDICGPGGTIVKLNVPEAYR